jgi:hypothetical protein
MKRGRDYENQITQIPEEMIAEILRWIPFAASDWLNFRLTCKKFLRLSKRFQDPSVKQNRALCWLSKRGYTNAVKELLDDHRVDLAAQDHKPAKNAARYGHVEILRMILSHPKNVLIPEGNYILLCGLCSSSDDWELVQAMLEEKNYKYKQRQQLLTIASSNGKYEIARGILKNRYWNPKHFDLAIGMARAGGHENVVRVLVNDRRYDGSKMEEIFYWACYEGHVELFYTMLRKYDNEKLYKSIVGTNQNIDAKLIVRAYNKKPVIAVCLLKALFPDYEQKLFDYTSIAIAEGENDIARALLRDPKFTIPKGYEDHVQEWSKKLA